LRLTGYLYPFRKRDAAGNPTDDFLPGTDLQTVWHRYNFDRRLRIVLLDAIERIEVAVRTQLVYHFVRAHGPFGYLEKKNCLRLRDGYGGGRTWRNLKSLLRLKGLENSDYQVWLANLGNEKKPECAGPASKALAGRLKKVSDSAYLAE
jgi:abortive infection bacteriophage resistance protein